MNVNEVIANRYEVIRLIGQGGMADVYLALDTVLNRQVAIKLMRGELSDDSTNLLRFEREAKAVADLSHPNVVEIYDIGTHNDRPFMVMEYVKGYTLKELLRKRGALDVREALDIAKQMVLAIKAAHDKGIIHRDIKPQNIIIKFDCTVKMMDFGIALTKDNMQLTQADSVMGSVHYLAPELAKGKPASVQSDIYALGIVLYEMLVGDVPFKDDNAVKICLKHIKEQMPSVRQFNPNIPQALENIILIATAKNPKQRYASADLMYEALNKCLTRKEEPVKFSQIINEADETLIAQLEEKEFGVSTTAKQSAQRKHANKIKKRRKKMIKIISLSFTLVLIISIIAILVSSGIFDKKLEKKSIVPNIIGSNVTQAKLDLEAQGLILDNADITYELTDNIAKGTVLSVEPDVNSELEVGSNVKVTVSSGIGVVMDDFTGWNVSDVENWQLQYPNLEVSYISEDSEQVDPGLVIRQELIQPGEQFNPDTNTRLIIYYSTPITVLIPNYIGWGLGEAEEALKEMGVSVTNQQLDRSTFNADNVEENTIVPWVVVDMSPKPGEKYTQEAGNSVTLYYYPE